MAPVGHTALQLPQPPHTAVSTAMMSPFDEMAPVGQLSWQLRQPILVLREWAQIVSS